MSKKIQLGDVPEGITDPVLKKFLSNIKLWIENPDRYFKKDGKIILADKSEIYYDGQDLIIDPKKVGSGKVVIKGDIEVEEYSRDVVFSVGEARKGSTQPTSIIINTYQALRFDADAEKAYLTFEVPADYVNAVGRIPVKLDIHWVPESPIPDGETVKFDIMYVCKAHDESIDAGTPTSKSATFTQSGAGIAYAHAHIGVVMPIDDANNPINRADIIGIEFGRDMTGDTFTGDVAILKWALHYPSNTLSSHGSPI